MSNTVFMAIISISFAVLCIGFCIINFIKNKQMVDEAVRICEAEINRYESKLARKEKIIQNLQLKLQGEYARKNPPQSEFIEFRDKVSKGEKRASDRVTFDF